MFKITIFLFSSLIYLSTASDITGDDYKLLPPIYEMQDYSECIEKNDLYCKVDAKLNSLSSESKIWKLINITHNSNFKYDNSIIFRAICVPRKVTDDQEAIKQYCEMYIDGTLKHLNIVSSVDNVVCITSKNGKLSAYDISFLFLTIVYGVLIIYSTLYDRWTRKQGIIVKNVYKNYMIKLFSLIYNWEKATNENENEDYKKLKSIQGIRFYNMLSIMFLHTNLSYCLVYISNPHDHEKILNNTFVKYSCILGIYSVQAFFLISSWLLTARIYEIYKTYDKFTARHALTMLINRYLRVGVTSAIVIVMLRVSWNAMIGGPLTLEKFEITKKACEDNWIYTLFFINNNLFFGDMCDPPSWYLSMDFQLYVAAIATFYVIFKFKLNEKKVVGMMLLASCVVFGSVIYMNDMDHFPLKTLRSATGHEFFRSLPTRILYTAPYSNWSTSLIGMGLGIIYVRNKERSLEYNKVLSTVWALLFFGLLLLVAVISANEAKGITAVLWGSLLKPLFSLGIGIGILGMSHNIGGIVKRICEWKYIVLLSNFSFCTYMFQFFIIFTNGISSYSLIEVGPFATVKQFISNVTLSLAVGVFATLIIEQPGLTLQKMLLPQIKMYHRNTKKEN